MRSHVICAPRSGGFQHLGQRQHGPQPTFITFIRVEKYSEVSGNKKDLVHPNASGLTGERVTVQTHNHPKQRPSQSPDLTPTEHFSC